MLGHEADYLLRHFAAIGKIVDKLLETSMQLARVAEHLLPAPDKVDIIACVTSFEMS